MNLSIFSQKYNKYFATILHIIAVVLVILNLYFITVLIFSLGFNVSFIDIAFTTIINNLLLFITAGLFFSASISSIFLIVIGKSKIVDGKIIKNPQRKLGWLLLLTLLLLFVSALISIFIRNEIIFVVGIILSIITFYMSKKLLNKNKVVKGHNSYYLVILLILSLILWAVVGIVLVTTPISDPIAGYL